ncbi:MAG: hypothetical protein M1832_004278 [Thelocarpon impressellum]|nr:MAG: hypothetical protein M1832_004278 [Thelocarpon impressellum]
MPPKRMTANPVKPARYRPGKPAVPDVSSDEEDEEEEEEEEEEVELAGDAGASRPSTTAPKAASFPSDSTLIASSLKQVDLDDRRRQAAVEEAARQKAEKVERAKLEEGFVTEESSEGGEEVDDSISEDEEGDEDEESSEEEEPKRVLLRPTFIKKDKRQASTVPNESELEAQLQAKEAERRQAADEIVEEQLRKEAEAHAAGKKEWDDEDAGEIDEVDDRDGLDPEAELASWKLRELKRVKRDREVIEEAEKERDEIERRRNLSKEEREEEDKQYLARQREEKDSRGQMGYMQKYFHKGAFFQDDARDKGLDRRDIMGSRYQDDVTNRELLPQYMQIRDMTKLGRKSRTKYKDLQSEDTGRWGESNDRGRPGGQRGDFGGSRDERFMPDHQREHGGATGANASVIEVEVEAAVTNNTSQEHPSPYADKSDHDKRRKLEVRQ